jgi:hypothetical protein
MIVKLVLALRSISATRIINASLSNTPRPLSQLSEKLEVLLSEWAPDLGR